MYRLIVCVQSPPCSRRGLLLLFTCSCALLAASLADAPPNTSNISGPNVQQSAGQEQPASQGQQGAGALLDGGTREASPDGQNGNFGSSNGGGADEGVDPGQLPDCASIQVGVTQLDLAYNADVVITGITLAAGPGAGLCDNKTGALSIALDNSSAPSINFVVLGVQCVHKGLLSCRSNEEDTKDCLVLVALPSVKSAAPCTLAQGERYMIYLQRQTNGCDGYYLAQYERVYHSVRRPLGGTGCSFYPSFPNATDMRAQVAATCTTPTPCATDACDVRISKSPCANDTSVGCWMKQCPGKWMYHNAIMPTDTCYEVYNYATSGLPTNCYGRRYINNRIRQLAGATNGTAQNSTGAGDSNTAGTATGTDSGGAAAGRGGGAGPGSGVGSSGDSSTQVQSGQQQGSAGATMQGPDTGTQQSTGQGVSSKGSGTAGTTNQRQNTVTSSGSGSTSSDSTASNNGNGGKGGGTGTGSGSSSSADSSGSSSGSNGASGKGGGTGTSSGAGVTPQASQQKPKQAHGPTPPPPQQAPSGLLSSIVKAINGRG